MVSMDPTREASYRGPDLKLFVRDVRDRQNKKRPISVRSWSTIKDVKDALQKTLHVPASAQRLYFGPLLTRAGELPNHRSLHDAGIYRSGETLLLDIKDSSTTLHSSSSSSSSILSLRYSNDICISSSLYDFTPKSLRATIQHARRGFSVGLKPEFILDGSGGTYFLHDACKSKIAVFKPADEEPYAENNPRGYLQQPGQPKASLREGIVPGEACLREVAAFLLDHGGLAGVPQTTLAEARHVGFHVHGARLSVAEGGACFGAHSIAGGTDSSACSNNETLKKVGSFQTFVHCECTMDDISPSMVSTEEVHKIAILDIRLMNADRNAANLLVRKTHPKKDQPQQYELVPIDHGYCLRSVCDVSWMDWCWLDWPQLKKPLSDKHKKYILDLDIEADARMLQEHLKICEQAVDYFRASSALLKAGVKAGLSLYDIAVMCCRNDNLAEIPSMMEKLFSMASDLAHIAIENERWHHSAASRAIVDQLTPRHHHSGAFSPWARTATSDRIRKSISSGDFLSRRSDSFLSATNDEEEEDQANPVPSMAQSSASDSSSDEDYNRNRNNESGCPSPSPLEGDCEEWAASLIAGMGVVGENTLGRLGRSCSVASSDEASHDSKSGFWHVRPGTSPEEGDNDSICWTPQTSPKSMVDLPEPPPLLLSPDPKTPPTVKFEMPSGPFLPPATVNVSNFKTTDSQHQQLFRQDTGNTSLSRSKSYSALSVNMAKQHEQQQHQQRMQQVEQIEDEYHRKYFHKFIDLVIVRETSAASVRLTKASSID